MEVFKIRNKLTGLYHSGGNEPSWGGGKMYETKGACTSLINKWKKAHLSCRTGADNWSKYHCDPKDLEIVEWELSEDDCIVHQTT